MSNIIQIKHGAAAPGKGILQPYELGYATNEGILYIGKEDGSASEVTAGIKTPISIADGGTNATTAAKARENLGVNTQAEILEKVYPVGAIYISTVATNPATLFGFGSWEAISDRFLIGQSSTHAAGSTGGATEQTVNLPNHTHSMSSHTHTLTHTHSLNSHTHGMSSHTHSVTAKGTNTGTAITVAQMPSHSHVEYIEYALSSSNSPGRLPIISDYGTSGTSARGYYFPGWIGTMDTATNRTMATGSTGSGGTHTHTFTGTAVNSGEPNTANTGGPSTTNTGAASTTTTSGPSSNTTSNPTAATMDVPTMPPYLSVYMWKRTA